ncbi:MAG: hypothetical protein ACJ76N_13780 [Thermoanaerobaculia bacterium]|jgi:hypothetical protein
MKKKVARKLRVSRETLVALTSAEVQTVAGAEGASKFSCPSDCGGAALCPATLTGSLVTD